MTIKQLQTTTEGAVALKQISQAYTEIASAKLKKIRDQVEKNRFYLEDLSQLYQVVKQKALEKKLLPPKNGKTVAILITSNYHFYGNVNLNLIKFFISSLLRQPAFEQIIIGKTAQEYLHSVKYPSTYELLILQNDFPALLELQGIVDRVKNYSKILVFYSQMESVMVQKPTAKDITQTTYLKGSLESFKKVPDLFIFEPEINKILDFFESQMTNLTLQQAFLDSELSRTASRLISMDSAQSNADEYLKEQRRLLNSAKRTITNTKILEVATSVKLLKNGARIGNY